MTVSWLKGEWLAFFFTRNTTELLKCSFEISWPNWNLHIETRLRLWLDTNEWKIQEVSVNHKGSFQLPPTTKTLLSYDFEVVWLRRMPLLYSDAHKQRMRKSDNITHGKRLCENDNTTHESVYLLGLWSSSWYDWYGLYSIYTELGFFMKSNIFSSNILKKIVLFIQWEPGKAVKNTSQRDCHVTTLKFSFSTSTRSDCDTRVFRGFHFGRWSFHM